MSLVPLLAQKGSLDRTNLYWHYPHCRQIKLYSSLRSGDWKLVEFVEDGAVILLILKRDPNEENDLARQYQEKAQAPLKN